MSMWQEYVEPKFRDSAPKLIRDENNVERMVIGGKVMNPGPFAVGGIGMPGGMHDPVAARTTTYEQAHPGGWDLGIRVKDMDREGIDHSVIYTSVGPFLGGDGDPALTGALCRAYNNWISDFCKQAPGRLLALAIVPLMDVETSVAELRRAVEQLGLVGVKCWVVTEGEEANIQSVLQYLGDDRVVWASDYPHLDASSREASVGPSTAGSPRRCSRSSCVKMRLRSTI